MKVSRTYGRPPKKIRAEELFDALTCARFSSSASDGLTGLVPYPSNRSAHFPPAPLVDSRASDKCPDGSEGGENIPERGHSRGKEGRPGRRLCTLKELNGRGECGTSGTSATCKRGGGVPEWSTEPFVRPTRKRKADRRGPTACFGAKRGTDSLTFVPSSSGKGPFSSNPLQRRSSQGSDDPFEDTVEDGTTRTSGAKAPQSGARVSETRTVCTRWPSSSPRKGSSGRTAPEESAREDGKARLSFGSVRYGGGEKTLISDAGSAVAAVLDFSFFPSPVRGKGRQKVLLEHGPPGDQDAGAALLQLCGQDEVLDFDRVLDTGAAEGYCKIGEGVYGEVYRRVGGAATVLKVVPVQGDALFNGERQKTLLEILPEVVISLELSSLASAPDNRCTNFVRTERVRLVKGKYHPALLHAWDVFHEERRSLNDRPDLFDEGQHFVVFELADGGLDLETWRVKDGREACSIFLQVACTLAVAEAAFEYEHRDLHLGNVLISATSQERVEYLLHGEAFSVPSSGVHVSITDHTLSRMRKGGNVLFADLSRDPSLFKGRGDYQFQVYRLVRRYNGNNWEKYHPYSNVLWLHYMLKKLRRGRKRTVSPSRRAIWSRLDTWCHEILKCSSASEFVLHWYRAARPVRFRGLRSETVLTTPARELQVLAP